MRMRNELISIAGAYADVDQGIVNDIDDFVSKLDELDAEFDRAVEEGRGAVGGAAS